ncbi:hypothetical protein ACTHGU_07405 [Chitinophagaceae bacterium MMS25-I14]
MTLLFTESQYIFDEANGQLTQLIIMTALLSLVSWLVVRLTGGDNRNARRPARWFSLSVAGIIFIAFAVYTLKPYVLLKSIERRGIQTGGMLTRNILNKETQKRELVFTYAAYGKVYRSTNVHWQLYGQDMNATAGKCYLVIYDSLYPQHAFMDLLEPWWCDGKNHFAADTGQLYAAPLAASAMHGYIYDEWNNELLTMFIFITLFAIIGIRAAVAPERFYYDSKGVKQDRRQHWIVMLIITLAITAAGGHQFYTYWHIKNNGRHAMGTLTKKYWEHGKHSGWRFEYRFNVNYQSYYGGRTYYRNENIKDSIFPGNCYIVVYDSTDPGNSFMDLHAPVSCDSDTLLR